MRRKNRKQSKSFSDDTDKKNSFLGTQNSWDDEASKSTDDDNQVADMMQEKPLINPAYRIIAKYLSENSSDDDDFRTVDVDEIERAIGTIATAQSAWKSMDGATHQLKNTLSSSSTSLASRFRKFMSRKTKRTKEAAKLIEYIDMVERGLQNTELLQTIIREANNSRRRLRFLQQAGVEEVDRFTIQHSQIKELSVQVTVLRPMPNVSEFQSNISQQFEDNELIVVINDDPSHSQCNMLSTLLQIVGSEEPRALPIKLAANAATTSKRLLPKLLAESNIATDLKLLPSILEVAEKVVERLRSSGVLNIENNHVATEEINIENAAKMESNDTNTTHNDIASESKIGASRIRVIGHSCGGSVAAYVAMLLDGFVVNELIRDTFDKGSRGQVRCMTFGAVPCVSREVVPSFITSVICGDDALCRLQRESLSRLREKVADAVRNGAGKRGLGWLTGVSLLGEMSHTASKQLGQYRGRKKESKGVLQLPGRVFYMKSRQLKSGATLQRVLRGNWQEDVMWNIRDLVLSSKMLSHHELEAYIRTLNRC